MINRNWYAYKNEMVSNLPIVTNLPRRYVWDHDVFNDSKKDKRVFFKRKYVNLL